MDSKSLEIVARELLSLNIKVLKNEPMSKHTTFRIGGRADVFCVIENSKQLVEAIKICIRHEVPVFILGGGSNILVSDGGIRGVTLRNRSHSFILDGEEVIVDSGYLMPLLARKTADLGLTGCEFAQAIPGTVGGGVLYNAHFRHPKDFGRYQDAQRVRDIHFENLVKHVLVMKKDGSLKTIVNEESNFDQGQTLHFVLRKNQDTVVRVRLCLHQDSRIRIQERLTFYNSYRRDRKVKIADKEIEQPLDPYTGTRPQQPVGATAGCIFQNVDSKHPSGRLIDMCGLKGLRIGGAQISTSHANFIVNIGGASADDVRRLIERCKSEVQKGFKIELVEEIEYVGKW